MASLAQEMNNNNNNKNKKQKQIRVRRHASNNFLSNKQKAIERFNDVLGSNQNNLDNVKDFSDDSNVDKINNNDKRNRIRRMSSRRRGSFNDISERISISSTSPPLVVKKTNDTKIAGSMDNINNNNRFPRHSSNIRSTSIRNNILNHNIFDHNDAPTLNNMQQVSGQKNNNNNNTNNNVETNNKKRSIMQEYLSKLQELHKGGLLTEHQRKKLKEGILLQANGVKEQINEKYELLEKFRNVTIDVIRKSGMKEGYLMKTAQTTKQDIKKGFGSYKTRYFCLRPLEHKLVYFATKELSRVDPTSLEYEALGEIDLSIGKRIAHIETIVNKPRRCKIVCANVSVMLKAKDEHEMSEWIEAFAEAKAATFYMKDGRSVRRDVCTYSYGNQEAVGGGGIANIVRSLSGSSPRNTKKIILMEKQGILVKRGENVRNWKARYFNLTEDSLNYYNSEEDLKKSMLGTINFADIESEDMISLSCVRRFAFKIITMNRTYFFMARSIEESRDWQNAISNNVRLYMQRMRALERTGQTMMSSGKMLKGLKDASLDRARQLFTQEQRAHSKQKNSRLSNNNRTSSNNGMARSSRNSMLMQRNGSAHAGKQRRTSRMSMLLHGSEDGELLDIMEQRQKRNFQRYQNIANPKEYKFLSQDHVPNFHIWNHREEIEYLTSDFQYVNFRKDNSKEMWGQFELFISTHDIVLSDEVYKLLNSKGNSIFSAIQRQFSAKREDLHASIPSLEKYYSEKNEAIDMKNFRTANISMYAVIYISQPTIESKEYLREKTDEGKVTFTKICRTETVEGTGNAEFAVAALISVPLNLAAVPVEFLFWNNEDDRTVGNDRDFDAIVRVEVYLNVGSTTDCLFGTSEYYLSEIIDALKYNVKVSHMMNTSNDLADAVLDKKSQKQVKITQPGHQPRTSITPFWPKFYSSIVQPLRSVMAQTYRFALPSVKKNDMYLDASLAKKRGSLVVTKTDGTDVYAREEVIEALLTFDVPSAWVRLKAEEWDEEHRRLGNYLGLYTQKSHEQFQKKGMKEMKEQREREEKSFNRAMEGLGLMNHNPTNGGKNIVEKIGTNDIGDDDNNNNMDEITRSISGVIKQNKSNSWRFRMLQQISDIRDKYTHLADIYTVFRRTVEQSTSRHGGSLTFKSSKKKKHPDFCFVATNLHTQFFSISTENHQAYHDDERGQNKKASEEDLIYTHDFITTGAPAAHHLGFEKGGLCSKRDELEEIIAYLQYTKDDAEVRVRDRAFSAVTQAHDEIKLINEMTSLHHEGFENESDGKALTIDFLTKRIATKNHIARLREDVVVSQAISGLCESFRLKLFLYAERLQNVIDNTQDANDLDWRWKNMFDIYTECGFLYQLESLLSTSDKELGMLQDAYGGIRSLKFCHLVVGKEGTSSVEEDVVNVENHDNEMSERRRIREAEDDNGTSIAIDNSDINDVRFMDAKTRTVRSGAFEITRLSIFDEDHAGELLIKLYVPAKVFDVLPKNIRNGQRIPVKPLMFTQGVNEKQALANTSYILGFGKSLSLQSAINDSSLRKLRAYFKVFERCAIKLNINRNDRASARNRLNALESEVLTAKINKTTWQILGKSANIVRFLGGGRATCCKSAKDRTSMSVTHEQARITMGLSSDDLDYQLKMANIMREFGVRIGNARKNIGKKRFAFNSLQRGMLPTVYRPPTVVAGNAVS